MFKLLLICSSLCFLTACSANQTSTSEPSTSVELESISEVESEAESEAVTTETVEGEVTTQSNTITKTLSGSITNGLYQVAAQITLSSDSILNLEQVSYTGRAPDVYIALGNIENGIFVPTEIISEKLDRAYENESLSFDLKEYDLSEFNAVSFWCDAYSEDFGSTLLVE